MEVQVETHPFHAVSDIEEGRHAIYKGVNRKSMVFTRRPKSLYNNPRLLSDWLPNFTKKDTTVMLGFLFLHIREDQGSTSRFLFSPGPSCSGPRVGSIQATEMRLGAVRPTFSICFTAMRTCLAT